MNAVMATSNAIENWNKTIDSVYLLRRTIHGIKNMEFLEMILAFTGIEYSALCMYSIQRQTFPRYFGDPRLGFTNNN